MRDFWNKVTRIRCTRGFVVTPALARFTFVLLLVHAMKIYAAALLSSLASAVVAFEGTVPCLMWSPKELVLSFFISRLALKLTHLPTKAIWHKSRTNPLSKTMQQFQPSGLLCRLTFATLKPLPSLTSLVYVTFHERPKKSMKLIPILRVIDSLEWLYALGIVHSHQGKRK